MTTTAIAACPPAARALPPLNPNQPTQSIAVPISVSARLCGGSIECGNPRRAPTMTAATRAAVPAVIWTTAPPAKSMTPRSPRKEPYPAQTMCAIGR